MGYQMHNRGGFEQVMVIIKYYSFTVLFE